MRIDVAAMAGVIRDLEKKCEYERQQHELYRGDALNRPLAIKAYWRAQAFQEVLRMLNGDRSV